MRAGTLGGFLVLPWPGSGGGGADTEHRLDKETHGLLKCGALLGVTVLCKNHFHTLVGRWLLLCLVFGVAVSWDLL